VKLRSSVAIESHRGDGSLSRDACSLEKTKESLVGQEARSCRLFSGNYLRSDGGALSHIKAWRMPGSLVLRCTWSC